MTTDIKNIRKNSLLNKQYNFGGEIMSAKDKLDEVSKIPGVTIKFLEGTGKKRNGIRLPTKPKWYIDVPGEDQGFYDLGKIGAIYINDLIGLGVDIEGIETTKLAAWQRQIDDEKRMWF